MKKSNTRWIAALSLLTAVLFLAACSGGERKNTLDGTMWDATDLEAITVSLAGEAKCPRCLEDEIPITGLQVEVIHQNDPMHMTALRTYDGLGPFSISNIQVVPNATLEVMGTLYRQTSTGTSPIRGYAAVEVPNDDGQVIPFTLTFPSSASDDDE